MNKYFLHDGENHIGPFSLEELKIKKISKETPVWFNGISEWTNAGFIDELKVLFEVVPPPFKTSTNEKINIISAPEPSQKKGELSNKTNSTGSYDNENIDFLNFPTTIEEKEDFLLLLLSAFDDDTTKQIILSLSKIIIHPTQFDQVISELKSKSAINDIINSKAFNSFDKTLCFLCSQDKRSFAKILYRELKKESRDDADKYINYLISVYKIDMTREKERFDEIILKREAEKKEIRLKEMERIEKELGEFESRKIIAIISIIVMAILSTWWNWYVNNHETNLNSETLEKSKKIYDYMMYILIGAFVVFFHSLYFANVLKQELKGLAKQD